MRKDQIALYLPEVFRDAAQAASPLDAILGAMEALHAPSEKILDDLDAHIDPRRATDDFLPYLSSWVDLDRYLDWSGAPGVSEPHYAAGLGRLRELIAAAAELGKWRGTMTGLTRFLEIATGVAGFGIDENPTDPPAGAPSQFHIRVRAPAAAKPISALVQRIVEEEKPAYLTFSLEFDSGDAPHS
jgi:phage tail-like protein